MTDLRLVAGSLTLAACVMSAYSASAIEFSLQPRVSIGEQYYEYEAEGESDVNSEVNYVFGGLGLTAQIGKFFVDVYGQTNLTEGEDDDPNAGSGRETAVSRREVNVTAGFVFARYVTAFGGLKYARNESENDFESGTTIDLETDYFGPFAGLALNFPISNVGAISLNGSLAYLDGEETIDNSNLADDVVNDGKALGYAVGLGWSGRFGPSVSGLGYGIGLDYSAYDFEEDGEDEFKEQTIRLRADLKYRF